MTVSTFFRGLPAPTYQLSALDTDRDLGSPTPRLVTGAIDNLGPSLAGKTSVTSSAADEEPPDLDVIVARQIRRAMEKTDGKITVLEKRGRFSE